VFIAAGEQHTCAVLETGTVRCWGNNHFGQLGYGNTAPVGDDETPASVGDVRWPPLSRHPRGQ
jgi:alpha-tubulin suppressor-like RCC1 family protein